MPSNPLALVVAALVIATPLAGQTAVSPGQTVTASLRRGDARMEGSYYDAYVIRGSPGEQVLVRMRSGDFAPFLRWGYENEERWLDVGFATDPGASPDSRIVVRLGDDGRLELRATAPDKGAVGEYELRLTSVAEPSAGRIRPGDKVVGRLDPADSEGLFGYEDHYVIQGPPGDIVTIYLKSDEFDTSMSFGLWRDDVRLPAFDDDTGPGNGSRLTFTFAPSAAHRLVVHAAPPGKTGAYTLHVLAGPHREDTDWGADKSFTGPTMADAAMWTDTMVWTDSVLVTDTTAGIGAAADMVMTAESPEVDYQVLPIHADQLVHG
ncbi:MAG TPA: hypothetical protein VFR37_03425, partial [Longimicrobium sp.]|nr:hypothetical protein [Longimicrobium sp.]